MRVLVTGHLGYIGTVLTPMLVQAGHEVVGLTAISIHAAHFRMAAKFAKCRPSARMCETSRPKISSVLMRCCIWLLSPTIRLAI